MKQIELAKMLNWNQAYLSMILSGKRPMQWDLAKRLAKFFGNDASFWMDASPEEMNKIIKNNDSYKKLETRTSMSTRSR